MGSRVSRSTQSRSSRQSRSNRCLFSSLCSTLKLWATVGSWFLDCTKIAEEDMKGLVLCHAVPCCAMLCHAVPLIMSLQLVKFCEVLQCGAHLMLGRFLDRLAAGYEVQVLELTDSMHLYAFYTRHVASNRLTDQRHHLARYFSRSDLENWLKLL